MFIKTLSTIVNPDTRVIEVSSMTVTTQKSGSKKIKGYLIKDKNNKESFISFDEIDTITNIYPF